jgi:hypothetical protein
MDFREYFLAAAKDWGYKCEYRAERDAAGKLTVVHRSKLFSGWHGEIEEAHNRGRLGDHALQIAASFLKTHRMMLDLFLGWRGENVFFIRYWNEDNNEYKPTFPLTLPNTESEFRKIIDEWAERLRAAKKSAPVQHKRRRGRPIDPRITAQQRRRVRVFLAALLDNKGSIAQAEQAVMDKYGVDRRTVARDRKAHEAIERYPPIMGFAMMVALIAYGERMGWRMTSTTTEYWGWGVAGGDIKSTELVS